MQEQTNEMHDLVDETPTDALVARNFRSFMIIWAAQLVARIGNGLTAFGLSVYLYQLTGRATSVALVTMAAFLPAVLLGPLAGVLADRFDRRLLMILGDSLSAVGLIALLVAFRGDFASEPVILGCVAFSSIFSSVMDPAYRATVSDLLTPKQYARAGGLVQLASASQYLVSPALAGLLMMRFDISLILLIDVLTMVVTTTCMLVVWRQIGSQKKVVAAGFWEEFRSGVRFLHESRGIMVLIMLVTLVTFCMGFLQTLLTPMLLDLANEEVLGVVRSLAAVGMVVSSLVIGAFGMGMHHLRYMAIALVVSGISVSLMGATTSVLLIGVCAFIFFMTLPPLSTSVEVLTRSSIPNETQGKVWGLIGLISQLGYIAAYALSGILADYVFNPLLRPDGPLAGSVGTVIGVGESRGIALMFVVVGVMLFALAFVVPRVKSIQVIEASLDPHTTRISG